MLMNKAVLNESLAGIKMKINCTMVSHLLFADDSLVFLEANAQSCTNFLHLANAFSEASGLSISAQKSSLFFSSNASMELKKEIKWILGMKEMDASTQYLGLPALWGRSKKEYLGFIKDRIMGKVKGWVNKHLNQAGKEVLVKSVILSMPMFPFTCFKAPSSLCSLLNSIISKFWWENGGQRRKIHLALNH